MSSGLLCWRKLMPSMQRNIWFIRYTVNMLHVGDLWKILSTSVRVCGSYTDMTSGTPSEAMMDFTGGVHMCVQLSDASSDVWGLICRAGKSNTLMGCGTPQGVSTKKQNSETARGYSGRLFSNYKKGLPIKLVSYCLKTIKLNQWCNDEVIFMALSTNIAQIQPKLACTLGLLKWECKSWNKKTVLTY